MLPAIVNLFKQCLQFCLERSGWCCKTPPRRAQHPQQRSGSEAAAAPAAVPGRHRAASQSPAGLHGPAAPVPTRHWLRLRHCSDHKHPYWFLVVFFFFFLPTNDVSSNSGEDGPIALMFERRTGFNNWHDSDLQDAQEVPWLSRAQDTDGAAAREMNSKWIFSQKCV